MTTRAAPAATRGGTTTPDRAVPGEIGIWVLVGGELVVFTVVFVGLLATRRTDPDLARVAQGSLDQAAGLVNTLLLLTSSFLVARAVGAIRSARLATARYALVGALACGGAFAVVKIVEYHQAAVSGITPATNSFVMYYFVLTGLHLLHVVIGLGVLAAVWRHCGTVRPSGPDVRFCEVGGIYWHMVDLLWLVIFPLLYLVH